MPKNNNICNISLLFIKKKMRDGIDILWEMGPEPACGQKVRCNGYASVNADPMRAGI